MLLKHKQNVLIFNTGTGTDTWKKIGATQEQAQTHKKFYGPHRNRPPTHPVPVLPITATITIFETEPNVQCAIVASALKPK